MALSFSLLLAGCTSGDLVQVSYGEGLATWSREAASCVTLVVAGDLRPDAERTNSLVVNVSEVKQGILSDSFVYSIAGTLTDMQVRPNQTRAYEWRCELQVNSDATLRAELTAFSEVN